MLLGNGISCEDGVSDFLRVLPTAFLLLDFSLAVVTVLFYKKCFEEVSREFDEFQVNTHLCQLRCWYL